MLFKHQIDNNHVSFQLSLHQPTNEDDFGGKFVSIQPTKRFTN